MAYNQNMVRDEKYRVSICEKIVREYTKGKTIKQICEAERWLPSTSTVYKWMGERPEFRESIRIADLILADEMVKKAEDAVLDYSIPDSRAAQQLQLYKWKAGKLNRRKYGENVQVDHVHEVDFERIFKEANKRLATEDLSNVIEGTVVDKKTNLIEYEHEADRPEDD